MTKIFELSYGRNMRTVDGPCKNIEQQKNEILKENPKYVFIFLFSYVPLDKYRTMDHEWALLIVDDGK